MGQRIRSAAKESQWRLLLERQERSGASVREFCRQAGISEPSFYAWRKEIRRRDAEERDSARSSAKSVELRGLVPVAVLNDEVKVDSSSIVGDQAATAMPPSMLEIVTPSGFTLRFDQRVDARQLEFVLGLISHRAGDVKEVSSC